MLNRIKGTQDILDVRLLNFFLATVRDHLQKYHFTEIITPVLERTELFKRAVGLATDIVSKEMYFVHAGKEEPGSEEEICLRPEITASITRAFLNNGIQRVPWKVFTYGPVFRHERPQKGRYREFYQVSIEVVGTTSVATDAYMITMFDRLFHEKLSLNNYGLLINFLGCPSDRARYREKLYAFLVKHESEICSTCNARKEQNILRVLDCKNPNCVELYKTAPKITDFLCEACFEEWMFLQNVLLELSISYTHDPKLVRGLDYYNKTVFEFIAVDQLGAQNAFCAGGRYDTLATNIGADKDYPSLGAAIGVERIIMMLHNIEDILPLPKQPALHVIIPLSKERHALALQVADSLQAHHINVDIILDDGSLKSMMRKAHAEKARTCILIGSEEQASHTVTLKDMQSGSESKIKQIEIIDHLASLQ